MIKPIPGYEQYTISDTGQVWCLQKKVDVSPNVRTFRLGKGPHTSMAQLVAQTFIPNPDGLKYVIHLNGKLADNRVANLAWNHAPHKKAITRPSKRSVLDVSLSDDDFEASVLAYLTA